MIFSILLSFCLAAFASQDSRLIQAVNKGSLQEVTQLAKSKKELNGKDADGYDALFYAVSLNDLAKTKALLKAGAQTQNLYSNKKESLLFEAARLGSQDILEVLLKKNPKLLKIQNTDHETALFEAVRSDQSKVVQYLVQKGLSLQEKNKSGKTAQDYADPQNKVMMSTLKKLNKTN